MTNQELKTLGKAYLQCQRSRVGCELQMQKLIEHRLMQAGVATKEIISDDDGEGGAAASAARAANAYKKTKLIILDENKAKEVREKVQQTREYQNLVKYKASLLREEKDFLYTATQVSADSPIWDFAKRVRGFGDVAVMTAYTIIDTEQIADSTGTVTAGRVWKYIGLVPGQRLKSGELGGFNTTLKGRWYMIRKNLIMAKEPYYGEIYKIMKEVYLNRPDLVALNGSTVKGSCGHFIASLNELKRIPDDEAKLSARDFLLKFRLAAARQEIEKVIKDEVKEVRKQNKGASKKDVKGAVDELNAELERRVKKKEKQIRDELVAIEKSRPGEINDAVDEVKTQLGYKAHCPRCKETVDVDTVENHMRRPGWKKWIDEMAGRWMGKLLLSHVTEIIATSEGYKFTRHSDYIPPKSEDDHDNRKVIEKFRQSRADLLMRYVNDFAEYGNAQSAKDNMQSWWEHRIHGGVGVSRGGQQQQHRG